MSSSDPVQSARDADYAQLLGQRVRQIRARRGMPRRALAAAAEISERYIAQLESGRGNPSIMVLNAIARALHVALDDLVDEREEQPVNYLMLREYLRGADEEAIEAVLRHARSSGNPEAVELTRIALVGLRGAGKSTLGQALATKLRIPFVELVQETERCAGLAVSEILARGGQTEYRRYERDALAATLDRFERVVIAAGGSLVSEPATYELLLSHCYTVWLKATPKEHMERVIAQGDHRPMANQRDAMADLKRILRERGPLYRRAHATVDTAGQSPAAVIDTLLAMERIQPLAGAPA